MRRIAFGKTDNPYEIRTWSNETRLDKLGIGILRELLIDESTLTLQADVRKPYRDIARKLRVTEDTVRNRIQHMHDTGFIQRWRLGFNPTLFDLQMEYIGADVNPPSNKEDVIRWARAIPRVLGIQSYADGSVEWDRELPPYG